MSDTLENKAVEILDKSQAAIAGFADQLQELAKQYGPDVADAALMMARIDAAQGLVGGVVAAVITWVCFVSTRSLIKKAKAQPYEMWDVGAIIVGVCGAFAALVAVLTLADIWRWVGIFEPKLWLAKRILGL